MARRRLTTALLALGLTGGTAAAAIAAGALDGTPELGRPITLGGQVEDLVPAAPRELVVRFANPNGAPLLVSSVTTEVSSPTASCPASALRVGDLRSPVTVPAQGAASGAVAVTLAGDAPAACQGVRFALSFRATGRGEGTLVPADTGGTTTTPPATTPQTPVTPSSPKTRTKIVRKRVCKRRRVKVRVHGRTVRRWKRVCRTVKVKVKVAA